MRSVTERHSVLAVANDRFALVKVNERHDDVTLLELLTVLDELHVMREDCSSSESVRILALACNHNNNNMTDRIAETLREVISYKGFATQQ